MSVIRFSAYNSSSNKRKSSHHYIVLIFHFILWMKNWGSSGESGQLASSEASSSGSTLFSKERSGTQDRILKKLCTYN